MFLLTFVYMKSYALIRVSEDTKKRLDEFKAQGQSYNGLLWELLQLAEKAGFGKAADRLGLLKPTQGLPLPKKSKRGRWKRE